MEAGREKARIVGWIKEQVAAAGARGTVVGLSGGIDSSIVAVLCKEAFPDNCLGIVMPCYSNPIDSEHAHLVASKFDIPVQLVNLETTYEALREATGARQQGDSPRLALANIKPRLRMTTLYYYGGLNNYLVAGTGNRSEIVIGYYTKYGDGGVDCEPIGHLVKSQVREMAEYLGIPRAIIDKPPSAGLWEQQTDEGEMGVSYDELDAYILTGKANPRVKERVDKLIAASEHKRHMPPAPKVGS
ncbi:MAG: NAD+ synthase [Bacillota bacterium]